MRNRVKFLLLPIAASLPSLVHAQIYICKDSTGRTITSDRPVAECANRAMRELGSNGATRREIPAPLTAEQKRQKQDDEVRLKAAADALLELRRRDAAILERFRSENEIHLAHKRAMSESEQKLRLEVAKLGLAEKQLKDAQGEAELRKPGSAITPYLTRKIDEARSAIETHNELIRQHKSEALKVDFWFDETLKRYRELTGAGLVK